MPQDDHEIMNHAVVQTEFERACNSTLLASVGNRRAPLTAQVTVKSRQTSHVACLYAPSIRAMQKASRVAPFGSTSTSCEAPFLGLGAHEGFRAGDPTCFGATYIMPCWIEAESMEPASPAPVF